METILIIDDDESIRDTLEIFFSELGYKIQIAKNGKLGLEFLEKIHPDLVITDLKMPGMDGLEVLKRIRGNEITRRSLVVILTSSKEEQDIATGYDLGVNSYIRKPVDFYQFAEAIKQLGIYWLLLNEQPPSVL